MEHLRELRERKSLYQKDVAAALKIDRTTYVKYETGASEPSFEILKRIARFYDVSIDFLLGVEGRSAQDDFDKLSMMIKEAKPKLSSAEIMKLIALLTREK